MNDPFDHATGVEKWELIKQKEGVDVSILIFFQIQKLIDLYSSFLGSFLHENEGQRQRNQR